MVINMNKCNFIDKCRFFEDNYDNMPVTAIVYKSQYCDMDFEKCARNMTAAKMGPDQVPDDLLPCQNVRARLIIAGNINHQS
jgi:hypothetical protein